VKLEMVIGNKQMSHSKQKDAFNSLFPNASSVGNRQLGMLGRTG